jgi:hypothetical protein
MSIRIEEVISSGQRRAFARYPFSLYKDNEFWVPPFFKEEVDLLDPGKNPAFAFCDVKLWLAYKDGRLSGRIGAIINHLSNEKHHEKNGRFTRLEAIDDREVIEALMMTAESWLREKGISRIHGPLGFVNLDHQGLLIEGFDHLPSIVSSYHLPYYRGHLEALGYQKEIDWLEFRLTIGEIPEKALALNELIKKRYKLKVIQFKSAKELRKYAGPVFSLLNDAFNDLPYTVPYNPEMIRFYTGKFFNVLLPKYVKVVTTEEGEMIGFIICIPSLSEAFRKAKGSLIPFGFFHIMKALKKNDVADLVLTGVNPHYQKMGVSAILITEQQKTLIANGIKFVETTGMFETNHLAIQHWKNYPHIQHKRRRCFFKEL